jgi:acyl carrier protein
MVPSGFVELGEIPLTPNGKVDRLALLDLETRQPAATAGETDDEVGAPKSEIERRIAEIWRAVLRVERVATDSNFFDLGGHSLLLAEVHAHLRREVSAEVSIVELFQYPTVSGLAAHLEGSGSGAQKASGDRARRGRNLAAGRRAMRQRRKVRE